MPKSPARPLNAETLAECEAAVVEILIAARGATVRRQDLGSSLTRLGFREHHWYKATRSLADRGEIQIERGMVNDMGCKPTFYRLAAKVPA